MYAIVDIETTGGFADSNGITEIAILLHNGIEEEGRFTSLIHPAQSIPRYITSLTGITNDMVQDAPRFEQVASQVHALLKDRIFVAHNVNFDYSFLKTALEQCGYSFQVKKLCTVRMARKFYPGLASYSLGNLCRSLMIPIENRHRATGDAMATACLFSKMVAEDNAGLLIKMIKGKNAEQWLPPHVSVELLQNIPQSPGVYYFENARKEVIYVGKAINLIKRIKSHFSNNDSSKRKQDLLRQVHHIRYQECASELMALVLESQEIRRLWPLYNRSQKKFHHKYGIYSYEDHTGLLQLAIDKKKSHLPAIYTFNWLHEGQAYIRKIKGLSASVTETQTSAEEAQEDYNLRLKAAIKSIQNELPSFVLVEISPLHENKFAVYLMEKGIFYGMGYVTDPYSLPQEIGAWKQKIEPSPDNDYIRGLLYQFAGKQNLSRLDLQD